MSKPMIHREIAFPSLGAWLPVDSFARNIFDFLLNLWQIAHFVGADCLSQKLIRQSFSHLLPLLNTLIFGLQSLLIPPI